MKKFFCALAIVTLLGLKLSLDSHLAHGGGLADEQSHCTDIINGD